MHRPECDDIKRIKEQIGDVSVFRLFCVAFMREYTSLPDIEALFTLIGVRACGMDDLHELCLDNVDDIVKETTEFSSWYEMATTACDYYIANNIK